jgi:hypothetical protein
MYYKYLIQMMLYKLHNTQCNDLTTVMDIQY